MSGRDRAMTASADLVLAAAGQLTRQVLEGHVIGEPVVWAAVKEYVVCAFPDRSDEHWWRLFSIRVIRFDDSDTYGDNAWGVFDYSGPQGRGLRLGSDGAWSYPPEDDVLRERWRQERRFTEAQALRLAHDAAPHMIANTMTIKQTVAWLARQRAKGTP